MSTFGDIRNNFQIAMNNANRLNELEFKDNAAYKEYVRNLKGGKTNDSTEVFIAGKLISTEKIQKDLDAIMKKREASRSVVKDEVVSDFNLDQVAWENKEDKEKFKKGITKLLSGEKLSKEELANVNKYAAVKDSDGNAAIYLSTETPGDFRQGVRKKIDLKGSQAAIDVMKELADNGMSLADAVSTAEQVKPKLTEKQCTISKISKGRTTYKIEKGEKDKDGKVSSVKVGDKIMRRQKAPSKEALIKELMKNKSKEEATKEAEKTIKGIKRYNKLIDVYAEQDVVKAVELVEGADTATKEGREKIANQGPKIIANKLSEFIKDRNPTVAEKKVLDRIENLGNITDPEEYEKEAMDCLKEMGNTPSIKKAAPAIAESLVLCAMNKKGIPTIAPAGETFKVADLIQLPESDLDPNDTEYLQKLAEGGEVIVSMTTAGGLSVKKDGGAASGFEAKLGMSTFKNKDTKDKLQKILDFHNHSIATTKKGEELSTERINEAKSELDAVEKWAKENLDEDMFPLTFPNGRTPAEWAKDTVEGWIKPTTGKMKKIIPDEIDESNKADLIKGLEQYARGGLMAEAIHNKDLDFQDYHNANANTRTGEIELSDGINCVNDMAFSANPGFDAKKDKNGRWIVRPNAVYAGNLKKKCS